MFTSLFPPFPDWAVLVAENSNEGISQIVVPFCGIVLSVEDDTFNYYNILYLVTVEQTFYMIVNKFQILWAPSRYSVAKSSSIVVACFRLHKYVLI